MKEYLKMADYIIGDVSMSINHNGDVSVSYNYADPDMIARKTMDAMEHAINSHDELVAEVGRLTQSLNHANSNHELFERQYYLEKDKCEDLQAEVERLRGELKSVTNQLMEADQMVQEMQEIIDNK